jgi:WD40 repeat protein
LKWLTTLPLLLVISLCGLGQGPTGFDAQGDALPPGSLARLGSLRFRHDAPITCQAISHDSRLIATGGGRSVRVWEAATGRQKFALTMMQGNRAVIPTAVAFSSDGNQLAALGAFSQGVLGVWDLRGGQTKQEVMLPQKDDSTTTMMDAPFLAFTSTGKHVLIKNYSDFSIRMIEIATASEVRKFMDTAPITCMAISQDGKTLAAGTEGNQIILWNIDDGKELRRLKHTYFVVNLAFSPDGQRLASMDQELAPTIWNVASGEMEMTLPYRTRSASLCWSGDGQSLYVSRVPDQVVSWNLSTRKETLHLATRGWVNGPMLAQAQPKGSDRIILGSLGRRGTNLPHLRMLTLQGKEATQFDGYSNSSVFPIYLAARRQWATLAMEDDNVLRLWNDRGVVSHSYEFGLRLGTLRCFAQSLSGTHLVFGTQDGNVHLVNVQSGKLERTIPAFNRTCYDVEFTQDGKQVIATDLRLVHVYDMTTGQKVHQYELHTTDPLRTTLSHDGTRLATMHYRPEEEQVVLRVMEAATGKVLSTDARLATTQQNFHLSHDGRNILVIASRGRGAGVTVIETASGKTRYQAELPSPYQYVSGNVRLSPDGHWLAMGVSGNESEQYAAAVWKLGASNPPLTFAGHRGMVQSCHFSHDGKQMLTTCNDTTMLVWDVAKHLPGPATPWEEKQYLKHWQDLGQDDASRAYTTIHLWARQPNAAVWLGEQLRDSVAKIKPEQISQWLKQLNATQYAVRQEATELLTKHAAAAKPQLLQALEQNPAAEVKRRIDQILDKARESSGLSDNPLLYVRGIEALELMGSATALQQLQLLAVREDTLGREAREAAERLRHRIPAH